MARKKDTKVQEPGLTKKTLPKDVIASLKEFRKNRSLKGISLKKTIKEGRQ